MNQREGRTIEATKSLEAQLGADFSFLGLEFSGVIQVGKDAGKIAAYARKAVNPKDILDRYKIVLPEELNGLELEVKKLFCVIDTRGEARFVGVVVLNNKRLSGNLAQLGAADSLRVKFDFTIAQGADKASSVSIDLHGEVAAPLIPEIQINSFDLIFILTADGDWKLAGSITGKILDRTLKLLASYEKAGKLQTLQLAARFVSKAIIKPDDFAKIPDITSERIWADLKSKGYVDDGDLLTEKFELHSYDMELPDLDADCRKYQLAIIDALQSSEPIIRVPGFDSRTEIAAINVESLRLVLQKEGEKGTKWSFAAAGDLKLNDLITGKTLLGIEKGQLAGHITSGQVKLEFEAEEAKIKSPRINYIQVIDEKAEVRNLGFDINFGKISLELTDTREWAFFSSIDFCFIDIPSPLDGLFFKEFTGEFEIRNGKISAGITGEDDFLFKIPMLDPFQIVSQQIEQHTHVEIPLPELGEGVLGLHGIWINLENGLSLDLVLGIGLPCKLNELIGLEPHQIIRTYNDKNEQTIRQSTIKTRLSIGTEKITGAVLDSPFQDIRGIEKSEKKGDDWIDLDLDKMFTPEGEEIKNELGLLRIQKPELALDVSNGSFKASGGYEIDHDRKLKIPLFPIRKGLEVLELGEIAKVLPAGIPVKSIRFFDDDNELKVDELEKALNWMGISLPREIWGIIHEIARVADNLPDRFKDYLSINIPEGLTFSIDVTGDGSVSFDLRIAESGDPLQLLIPMLPSPQLFGVRLRGLSFGSAFANSLLKLELDGEFDMFDLPMLAGAVLINDENIQNLIKSPGIIRILPEGDRFRQTFIVNNLVVLIVYETAIPIPIPVFYDKLEYSYAGIDGFESRSVIGFPKPAFSATELLQRISQLKDFFTTRYQRGDLDDEGNEIGLLPLEHYGERISSEGLSDDGNKMDIRFEAGPIYLRLPKFLGAKDTEYYELTNDSYEALEKEIPDDCKDLSSIRRVRFLTREGFHGEVGRLLGNRDPELQELQQLVVDTCRHEKPLGQMLGVAKQYQISGWDLLYLILNSVKKGSINYPIQYFHIDDRIGDFELSIFEIFDIYATWALTTPAEFDDVAYPRIVSHYQALAAEKGLPQLALESPSSELLNLLAEEDAGEVVTADTEGAVVFMRGGLKITDAVVLESAFGIMLEGARGFRTGVSFYGMLANVVDAKLLGFIKISPKAREETFKLLGKSSLRIFNRQVAAGLFELTNERLVIDAMLDLFPEAIPIVLRGHIIAFIDKKRFLLDSAVQFEIGQLKALARLYMIAENPVGKKSKQIIREEFRVDVDGNVNALFIRLLFINSELNFSIVGQSDDATRASLDVDLYLTALRLIELNGKLAISADKATGFSMLGNSSLCIGDASNPLVTGNANLIANLDPVKGYFGVQSNASIAICVLSSSVRLAGGFAFYTWFGGEHAGDFVLSIGGYHPLFRRPAHYPQVPRLSLSWQIDRFLNVKGDAFFALTASCIMAGGRLDATWQHGGKKACFIADANFIAAWKPFQYYVKVHVSMGLSYTFVFFGTHTLACVLGADLELWGPELSGRAVIHIWRISFPIRFGKGRHVEPVPIGWRQFRESFLPAGKDMDDSLCKLVAAEGSLKDLSDDSGFEIDWIVNPAELKLYGSSAIPLKEVRFGNPQRQVCETRVGVAPMDLKHEDFHSVQTITLKRGAANVESEFQFTPIYQNAPKAMWGESISPRLDDSPMVNNVLTGYELTPKAAGTAANTIDVSIDVLMKSGLPIKDAFEWQTHVPAAEIEHDDLSAREAIIENLKSRAVSKKRNDILRNYGFAETDVDLDNLTRSTETEFLCAPGTWHQNLQV